MSNELKGLEAALLLFNPQNENNIIGYEHQHVTGANIFDYNLTLTIQTPSGYILKLNMSSTETLELINPHKDYERSDNTAEEIADIMEEIDTKIANTYQKTEIQQQQ